MTLKKTNIILNISSKKIKKLAPEQTLALENIK